MLTGWGLEPPTSQTSLRHATKSPIGLAHLEIPSRHEALLSLLSIVPAGHLPVTQGIRLNCCVVCNDFSYMLRPQSL